MSPSQLMAANSDTNTLSFRDNLSASTLEIASLTSVSGSSPCFLVIRRTSLRIQAEISTSFSRVR